MERLKETFDKAMKYRRDYRLGGNTDGVQVMNSILLFEISDKLSELIELNKKSKVKKK